MARTRESTKTDEGDHLGLLELFSQVGGAPRRDPVGLAPTFARQRLDQTGLLQLGDGAEQRARPERDAGERLDVFDQRVVVLGTRTEAGGYQHAPIRGAPNGVIGLNRNL